LQPQAPDVGYSAYYNSLVQIELADQASLTHYKWQSLDQHHAHIAASVSRVGEGAHLDAFVLNMGGSLVRQDSEVLIVGPQAEAIVNGAYIGCGHQHIDNTSQIKHLAPDSYSREVYKGVLSDQAQGVFQARILVDQIAQRTDAYQMNRALLLSQQSEVRSKPELEIYADDVKCSHGATVGQLDQDQWFYLMARGIPKAQAQIMLIEAYLEDVFADMTDRTLAKQFAAIAREKLHAMAEAA
ncbi:MAG: Fe-S cluster assembly protein SufD, partial [Alphaproteobacteria bacterium]|nr:Fe-S cluster assembly protein SufD [Alphaproteobacteria bacterium]